jgi:hypothetical protein
MQAAWRSRGDLKNRKLVFQVEVERNRDCDSCVRGLFVRGGGHGGG